MDIDKLSNLEDGINDGSKSTNKGYAPIKKEFWIIDYKPRFEENFVPKDVASIIQEQIDSEQNSSQNKKKKKFRGRNKNRPTEQKPKDKEKLCPHIIAGRICPFDSKCKFNHNVETYIKSQSESVTFIAPCYLFNTYGMCPFGITCIFAAGHTTMLNEKDIANGSIKLNEHIDDEQNNHIELMQPSLGQTSSSISNEQIDERINHIILMQPLLDQISHSFLNEHIDDEQINHIESRQPSLEQNSSCSISNEQIDEQINPIELMQPSLGQNSSSISNEQIYEQNNHIELMQPSLDQVSSYSISNEQIDKRNNLKLATIDKDIELHRNVNNDKDIELHRNINNVVALKNNNNPKFCRNRFSNTSNMISKDLQIRLRKREYCFSKANRVLDIVLGKRFRDDFANKICKNSSSRERCSLRNDKYELNSVVDKKENIESIKCMDNDRVLESHSNNLITKNNTDDDFANEIRSNSSIRNRCSLRMDKYELNSVVDKKENIESIKSMENYLELESQTIVSDNKLIGTDQSLVSDNVLIGQSDKKSIDKDSIPIAGEKGKIGGFLLEGDTNNIKEEGFVGKFLSDNKSNVVGKMGEKRLGPLNDEDLIRLRASEKKKIDFKHKTYLAPLTTVGNLPFRRICKKFGVDVTCGEMAMSANLLQGQASEWALLKRHESEDLFGMQLCGSFPDWMTRAVQVISQEMNVDFIDINIGCPIDLVVQRGEGCALMNRFGKLENVIKSVSGVTDLPITIKMRTGLHDDKNTAHIILPRIKDLGLSLITIHGRSREQRYSKMADWSYIKQCARAIKPIPLFGNGDVLSFEDYNRCLNENDVDGVMIARGALLKPWIFTEIKEQRHWDVSSKERLEIIKEYTNYGLEHWGSDKQGVSITRRFLLEWLSFLHRYIPVGLLEYLPQKINEKPVPYFGRNDLETLLSSPNCSDWIKITEMLLGPVPEDFKFLPKHKANSYR